MTAIYKQTNLLEQQLELPERILFILAASKYTVSVKENNIIWTEWKISFAENLTSIERVLKASRVDLMSIGLTFDEVELLKSSVSAYVQSGDYLTG